MKKSTHPLNLRKTNVKVAVFGCVHAPHTPPDVWRWAMDVVSDFGPDIVVNTGDWRETSTSSRYPSDDTYTLDEEDAAMAAQARDIERAAPGAKKILHEGNHEFRIDPGNIYSVHSRRLRERMLPRPGSPLDVATKGWIKLPYRNGPEGVFRVGQLVTHHGYQLGMGSDESEALHKAVMVNAPLHSLVVRSHTHKPLPPTQCRKTQHLPLPFWYSNVGTLGPLKPPYAYQMNTLGWGHGILLVDLRVREAYDSKEWEAELVRP